MEKTLSNTFSSIKNMTKITESVVDANEVSRIAKEARIKGDLISTNDIRIDGAVDGMVFSEGRIVVGENARMKGSMLCTNTDFWGQMEGDLYIKDILTLKSTSSVNGNIKVRKLQVEMGAQVNGTCQMISEDEYDTFKNKIIGKKEIGIFNE